MATQELTAGNFVETIKHDGITMVDFWAEWCGPCRQFSPIFEEASERHPDITFGKVDTEAERQLAAEANITSIPTLMVFREGILLYNRPGALPGAGLEDLITRVRELNMDEIRAEIEKQNASIEESVSGEYSI